MLSVQVTVHSPLPRMLLTRLSKRFVNNAKVTYTSEQLVDKFSTTKRVAWQLRLQHLFSQFLFQLLHGLANGLVIVTRALRHNGFKFSVGVHDRRVVSITKQPADFFETGHC